jgi:lipoprotein-anchoring transpeptidase ErfK/SrfK
MSISRSSSATATASRSAIFWIAAFAMLACATPAHQAVAEPLALADPGYRSSSIFGQVMRDQRPAARAVEESDGVTDPRLRRQVIDFPSGEAPGTIIIDTPNTYLYYVLGGGRAIRYGIGVGREGFTWSGVQTVARKAEWPDWTPPPEMVARQPYLPRFMAGGPGSPLGARAMYLGGTVYRIHGTNQPSTIGGRVSSGCIRMVNEDVIDLYGRVEVGTKVVVLPAEPHRLGDQAAQVRSAPLPVTPAAPPAVGRLRAAALH